jgi:acylphosphatase
MAKVIKTMDDLQGNDNELPDSKIYVKVQSSNEESTNQLLAKIDQLKTELEIMRLEQLHSWINVTNTSQSHLSYSPPQLTSTVSHSNLSTTSIHVVINTDPFQQMKDFVKPFNGSPNVDVMNRTESIIHCFDITQISGNKETL